MSTITFGLTGGIACGKSAVSRTFSKHNIPIVDADIVAREVVVPESLGWFLIRAMFGDDFLNEDQTLNRAKLGALVFTDAEAMAGLNGIMKPLIEDESYKQIRSFHDQGSYIVGYDAALIVEQGSADKYRPLIVVSCPQATQLERLMARNSLTHDEAMARINAQMPSEEKIKMADYIVDTSGDIANSIKQTEDIIKKLSIKE